MTRTKPCSMYYFAYSRCEPPIALSTREGSQVFPGVGNDNWRPEPPPDAAETARAAAGEPQRSRQLSLSSLITADPLAPRVECRGVTRQQQVSDAHPSSRNVRCGHQQPAP